MDDVMTMQVLEGFDGLADIVSGLALVEVLLFSQQVEQRLLSQFQHQVQAVVFLVEPVQLQTILMLNEELDLQLPNQTFNQFRANLLQHNLLDGVDRFCLDVLTEKDIAEPALAEDFAELEFLGKCQGLGFSVEDFWAFWLAL